MDRRLLLAIALSALVVIGYQEYLRIYYPQAKRSVTPTPRSVTPSSAPQPQPLALSDHAPATIPPDAESDGEPMPAHADIRVETPVFEAEISTRGGRLLSLRLRKYRSTIDPGSPGFQLVSTGLNDLPLGLKLRGTETAWSDANVLYEPSTTSLSLRKGDEATLVLTGALPDGGRVEKHLRFRGDRYDFEVGLLVREAGEQYSEVALSWVREPSHENTTSQFHGVEALIGNKIRHFDPEELERGIIVPDPRQPAATPAGPVRWAGYADTYFLSAILPRENDAPRLWVKQQADTGAVATEILVPIEAASQQPYPFTIFAGPKDLHILAESGHGLTRTVDLGWFGFVAEPMMQVLKFFHGMTGNYGVDIILLTLLIKLLFFPLTQKSFRSMQDLQKLQPEMKKLQERHKGDREQLNKEVMELYRRHKVNPLGGCLPMLLQMPIFIGLYNALLSAVELRHAPFALWINDLSAPDRLPALPAEPFAVVMGYDIRLPVLTLFMGASMLVQQKMTPQAADPMQQRMMMLMPVVFTVMFVNFPAGLVLYWLVNNILTIAQQAWMNRGRTQ